MAGIVSSTAILIKSPVAAARELISNTDHRDKWLPLSH